MFILIGSQHSLYTGKLRAYLRWKGLPFEEMAASQDLYRSVIMPRTGLAFIPVLVCPDNTAVLQDTHAIIKLLEQQHPRYPMLPTGPQQRMASMLLELYGDEWMVIPAMHYRWNFPDQLSTYVPYQFGKHSLPFAPYHQQLAAGKKVGAHFSGMLPALGISQSTTPVIEARFKWQLAVLQQHLQQLPYLLSASNPSTGDFGFMGPLYAHLYLDPVPGSLMKCTAPLVADWVERTCGISAVQHTTGRSRILSLRPADPQRPTEGPLQIIRDQQDQQQQEEELPPSTAAAVDASGSNRVRSEHSMSGSCGASCCSSSSSSSFVAGDVVPATLLPLLHHMFLEQMPAITSTLQLVHQWMQQQLEQQPGTEQQQGATPKQQQQQQQRKKLRPQVRPPPGWLLLPRSLGFHSFTLYHPVSGELAATGSRASSSYVAWRAAELAGWYDGLGDKDQAAVQQLLRKISAAGAREAAASTVTAADMRGADAAEEEVSVNQAGVAAVVVAGCVDAAAAFADMVQLVHACGRIERISNRVMVKPAAALAAAATTAAHGTGRSKL